MKKLKIRTTNKMNVIDVDADTQKLMNKVISEWRDRKKKNIPS